ncbi:MAG: hypothetical protein KQJ78_12235 [Deltaproteobacteria bacterium]|nr:hypothetical protein [Deltaproteobacteria bacterium]
MTPQTASPAAREELRRTALAGLAAALVLGAAAGWLRYWLGFFVLAQGAVLGLTIAWLAARAGRSPGGGGPAHPGFRLSLALAGLWFAGFLVGQLMGLGLAQPWFDPLGWLARVWEDRSTEFSFGLAATGPIHRAFALGVGGWFWLVLNLIDWAILFFFLWTMPWSHAKPKPQAKAKAKPRRKGKTPASSAAGGAS